MDTKTQTAADRVYEDFEPPHEWDKNDGRFTVMLPGKHFFKFSNLELILSKENFGILYHTLIKT